MEILLKKLEHYVSGWMKNEDLDTVNGHRTEILKHCLELGAENKGLFRLTVPTGGGKTVASLAFALRHAVRHQMDRIIYVIPYTSIIEQNAKVFREILGNENVLENHCNVSFENSEDSEEFEPMSLAAENWDKPVIVTTNVQFFESLFANKSSKCRKLHNIANSVVIFDEAQMLPADYLKPCISMIEEMVARYGVSAVLCTATQPSLEPFFQNIAVPIELCPRIEQQFAFFKRTNIHNIGWLEAEALIQRLNKEEQALCIVNTKKRAQKIYESIEGEGVYHLSTSMYPKHKKKGVGRGEKAAKGQKTMCFDFYQFGRGWCGSGFSVGIPSAGRNRFDDSGSRTVQPGRKKKSRGKSGLYFSVCRKRISSRTEDADGYSRQSSGRI